MLIAAEHLSGGQSMTDKSQLDFIAPNLGTGFLIHGEVYYRAVDGRVRSASREYGAGAPAPCLCAFIFPFPPPAVLFLTDFPAFARDCPQVLGSTPVQGVSLTIGAQSC